ncbi:hypothetical protein [Tianweitania sediminis]|jgi:hypothetical protein|uniref:Uncharacterized protein n=1 Tax=Tianweitania sediminis TaxID=1502156 RepID=A0A8J7QY90_9HYPH|nr:hypothetical protein [Tianweitania sediminis]MBP0438908.1 hypothetical protein [Tianweitania sediminis]HEV7416023.1 hypothetical protein [Tianweitania sediminis]
MDGSKPWYLSRTVWASLVTVAAAVGGLMGRSVGLAEQMLLTDALLQIVTAVSGVVAVMGRFAATAKIS